MKVGHQIESHADNSVTLRVGSITAHITGESWRDANDAAQSLGSLIAGRYELAGLRLRLSSIRAIVADIERSLGATTHHVAELAEYVEPRTTSASTPEGT